MACFLKQSTAVDVMLGPFLDSVDGNTIESGLTITAPDIRLSKNGGAFAQKSAAQTLTHGENGWYPVNLSTNDTGTVGILIVAVHESGALPVWREFFVLTANVYDSLLGNDSLQTDVAQWVGVAPNALSSGKVQSVVTSIIPGVIDSAAFNTGAITAAAIAADAITAAKVADGTIDAATFAAGAINAAAIAAGAIDNDALAADTNSYHAKVWMNKEGMTADKYGCVWFKNAQPVLTGVTSPTIQVFKASDGTDLIAVTAMTEVGSHHAFKKEETTNKTTPGDMYWAKVQATIDGATRTWLQPVPRDSTA